MVVVPTYDERDSIAPLVEAVRDRLPAADVLVVDDASPDGTGELVEKMAETDGQLHVLHRTGKLGLGSAYVAGFRWGLERGYDVLVEMDADGSHPAATLPALVGAVTGAVTTCGGGPGGGSGSRSGDHTGGRTGGATPGLAIGSRWVPGGSVVDWPRSREALSRLGNLYVRVLLALPVRDATAGFRAYRAEVLRALDLGAVHSRGYCFQVDMTLRTRDAGFGVVELPIQFRERVAGRSKMSRAIVGEAMARVTVWGVRRLARRVAGRAVGRVTRRPA
ncbi:polyprenol monophosphomannose synthase [Cellulomonas marina]|uniref:polyprenol monophosphomannose synthase n=1 Tax=Cellulomonas marina TaxID=988821 RepID=UPI0019446AF7|nr:polyprenol monophosphomannose synthase [Cellulomonas marina]